MTTNALASMPSQHDMTVTSKSLTCAKVAPNTKRNAINLNVSFRAAVLAPVTVTQMGGNDWFATTMAQKGSDWLTETGRGLLGQGVQANWCRAQSCNADQA